MLFIFSTPVLIRHLLQLKTSVFQHWCMCSFINNTDKVNLEIKHLFQRRKMYVLNTARRLKKFVFKKVSVYLFRGALYKLIFESH